jgi:hypothetical protein
MHTSAAAADLSLPIDRLRLHWLDCSWVKMDKCNSEGDRQVKAEQEAYGAFSHALNATGKSIHFNMCGDSPKPWLWADKFMQSWRTGDDHTGAKTTVHTHAQNLSLSIVCSYS